MRWAVGFVVPVLMFLRITPNQVTILNSVINFTLAAFCFAQGVYQWNLLGLLFLLLHSYFDFADGSLARATGQTSDLGAWLDPKLDVTTSGLILVSLGFGLYQNYPNSLTLILVLLCIYSHYAIQIVSFDFKYREVNIFLALRKAIQKNKKATFQDLLIKNFITLDTYCFLFLGTMRYFLTLSILVNQILIFFIGFTIFNLIRWVVMFWAYSLALSQRKSNREVIKALKKII